VRVVRSLVFTGCSEFRRLVADDLLHHCDNFLLLVKAVFKLAAFLRDLSVSTVFRVILFAEGAEFLFKESNLFLLLLHEHGLEIVNSVAESGVLVVRSLVFTGCFEFLRLVANDLLHHCDNFLLLVEAVSKVGALLLDFGVSAVFGVILFAQGAEFLFKESDLFFLGFHEPSTEVINLRTKFGVRVVFFLILTVLCPSSLNVGYLPIAEFANDGTVLIVLMAVNLPLFGHLEGELLELLLKTLASLLEFRTLCDDPTVLSGIILA